MELQIPSLRDIVILLNCIQRKKFQTSHHPCTISEACKIITKHEGKDGRIIYRHNLWYDIKDKKSISLNNFEIYLKNAYDYLGEEWWPPKLAHYLVR